MDKNRIGGVHVSLSASTQQFKKDMESAKTTVGGFGGFVSKATGFLNPMTAGITALAGSAAAAVGSFMTLRTAVSGFISSAEKLDSLAKTSDRLGMATEKLAGLRYAAGLSGASMETLDKGLTNMSRRLSEAAGRSGEAKASLDYLGLSAQHLASMSPDKAFYTLADAINRVGSQSKKTELAFDLFGRSGTDLMNTLAAGSSGLAAMQQEAERLGIAMSREAAAGAEQALDAFTRFGAVSEGVFMKLSAAAAPAVAALTAVITGGAIDAASQVANLETTINSFVSGAIAGFQEVTRQVHTFTVGMLKASSMLGIIDEKTAKKAQKQLFKDSGGDWALGFERQLDKVKTRMSGAGNAKDGNWMNFLNTKFNLPKMPEGPLVDPKIEAMFKQSEAMRKFGVDNILSEAEQAAHKLNEQLRQVDQWQKAGILGADKAADWKNILRSKAETEWMAGVEGGSARGGGPVAGQAFGSQGFASALAAAMNKPQNPELAEAKKQTRKLDELIQAINARDPEWLALGK